MKVLCLHGGQQTADIFENQINKLCVAIGGIASFTFIDAPFLLPLKDDRDDVQTRSWCDPDGDYAASDALLDAHMRRDPADILLGFSQGGMVICRYLLHHQPRATTGAPPLPKGVVFAGTPDPREAFADTSLLAEFIKMAEPAAPLFGSLPSLHIVGKKDAVVPPTGSVAFAQACGAAGELLEHEHAHSFPQQQAVIAAVRAFCEGAAVDPEGVTALAVARDMELDMVEAMYASQYGDDCVVRPRELSGGAVVTLPLLPADVVETGSASAAVAERALTHLSLRLRLPRRYPAVAPALDVVGGPAWHSVAFERWRADMVLRCTGYLEEDLGLGGAVVLPVHMYAAEQALEQLEELRRLFTPAKDGGHQPRDEEGGASSTASGATGPANVWALEDDEARATYIEQAEAEAIALLERKLTAAQPQQQQQQPDTAAGEKEKEEEGTAWSSGSGGGMGSPTKNGGGSWTLTIGLIGKPSAGKSTFFNAVTDPQSESEAARVAAFPFTTIEPNVGTGFGGLRCPCKGLLDGAASGAALKAGFTACDAAYGHVTADNDPHHRRHPILVKDVAGLVQGAYQGKGKGNQFLNDLCDADVLVHVVDGAGATDADGSACPVGQGSTLKDITWVRSEVHSWIYDNLRAKWEPIRRVPDKLRTMFSGYRSSPTFVDAVLLRMGIGNELALNTKLPTWGPAELHLLVALYTRMRFPMVVALNKADLPTAPGLARQLREWYPHEHFMPVSAQAEWDLLTLRKKGLVSYLSGEGTFADLSTTQHPPEQQKHPPALAKEDTARLQRLRTFFTNSVHPHNNSDKEGAQDNADSLHLTSTGVQDVLAEALSRCAAVLVYPVSALQPAIPSLKHCFSFKPGTTAEDIFWAMTYARLLDGKLVRFEVIDALSAAAARSGTVTTLKKMEPLPSKAVFVRVLSNKRQMT